MEIIETNLEFKKPKYEKQRQDIGTLLSKYKDALIYYLGEKKYNELTKKYGVDLATAKYEKLLVNKLEQQMIKYKMPKSEIEYILKKSFSGILISLQSDFRFAIFSSDEALKSL